MVWSKWDKKQHGSESDKKLGKKIHTRMRGWFTNKSEDSLEKDQRWELPNQR